MIQKRKQYTMKITIVTINLHKSCIILATEAEGDVPELYHQRKGEIARCWIKYCLTLMQNAQLSMQVIQSKVVFSFLNSRMLSKNLKWGVCSLDLLPVYYSRRAECSHICLFLVLPISPFSNLTHQLRPSQITPLPSRLPFG